EVDLGEENLVIGTQHVAGVGGQRVQVAQVGLRDLASGTAHPAYRRGDQTVGGAPAEHEHAGVAVGVVDREGRHLDAVHLGLAQPDHAVVVVGVVGDVPRDVGLLDAADAVLQAGRTGDRPRAG